MDPDELSLALRHIAGRIDRSEMPSRSSVIHEIRKILAAIGDPVSAGASRVVVMEGLSRDEVEELMREVGGTDLRDSPYGDFGFVVPLEKLQTITSDQGELAHVFHSWKDAVGDDPEYEFLPVDPSPSHGPSSPPV